MTIKAVERKIRHALKVIDEWDKAGLPDWPEVHIRYSIADPIIRALGWNTEDPKECHPEYPRWYGGKQGKVDYALFTVRSPMEMVNDDPPPLIIIETKALKTNLDRYQAQLSRYMRATPKMTSGIAVLTNGRTWRFYDASKPGRLAAKLKREIDIKEIGVKDSARTLIKYLGKKQHT